MKEQTRRALQAIIDAPGSSPAMRQWAKDVLAGRRDPFDPNLIYPESPSAPEVSPEEEP